MRRTSSGGRPPHGGLRRIRRTSSACQQLAQALLDRVATLSSSACASCWHAEDVLRILRSPPCGGRPPEDVLRMPSLYAVGSLFLLTYCVTSPDHRAAFDRSAAHCHLRFLRTWAYQSRSSTSNKCLVHVRKITLDVCLKIVSGEFEKLSSAICFDSVETEGGAVLQKRKLANHIAGI